MTTRFLIAIAALAGSASFTFASDLYHPSNAEEGVALRQDHMKSGMTRAQVEEGVMAAQREGTLTWISRGYPPRYPLASIPPVGKTRAQVEQELFEWKRQPTRPDGSRPVPGVAWTDPVAP